MARRLATLLALLFAVSVFCPSAQARDWHDWHVPGVHPLTKRDDGRTAEAISCAEQKLGMTAKDREVFAKIVATPFHPKELERHPTSEHLVTRLRNGMRFAPMLYKVAHKCGTVNVITAWTAQALAEYDNRAEAIRVRERDGSVSTFVRPFACNNWARYVPPPPRPRCYVVSLDYTHNLRVMAEGNLKTLAGLLADPDQTGPARAYLDAERLVSTEDEGFAFVEAHIDLNKAEAAAFRADPCTGIRDATGFHHDVSWQCSYCSRGQWPGPGMRSALARARGVKLPDQEPFGVFRFPCAGAKCRFSMPLWAAARWMIYCVDVPEYSITLLSLSGQERWLDWRASDDFDVVTAAQGTASLRRRVLLDGDIALSSRREILALTGAESYTEP